MKISVKKNTYNKMRKYCHQGEKHDNLVNRLIDIASEEREEINLSEETVKNLLSRGYSNDIDEALNVLMDKTKQIRRGAKSKLMKVKG